MKVIGIVGGPRKTGNTAKLVELVIEKAQEIGHETDIFYLGDMNIGPIKAVNNTLLYPEDDMKTLYPHIESMDALILGTPIYYDHVSSRTKLFIDRLHYYSKTHGEEYKKRFPLGVKFISLITYAWDKIDAYDDVIDWINERMRHYHQMQVVGSIKAEGTRKKPVIERKDLVVVAKTIVNNL